MEYGISFAVHKEAPGEAIRKLEPFVKVTIMDFEKNKIGETEALIDTGSHVNIMSKDCATKNKWKIFESETIIKGVDHQKIKVVGITYVIMALAEESAGFVKFIVVNNPGQKLLLGQDFHRVTELFIQVSKNEYKVFQKRKNGKLVLTSFWLRPCKPNELKDLIELHEQQTRDQSDNQTLSVNLIHCAEKRIGNYTTA